ncbi:transglutaminase family protein [Variovorax sp. KK3]|uniref:transglutaminase-like domain-containing protein n=1 Tax=Variovorax sp. KK3 TaxID=1855728 RepID=UPI00097C95CD|nr:transglutaminase family protein [Variovorax sp. KK3]
MKFHVGFEMTYECVQPTPMLLLLSIHFERASDLIRPDALSVTPMVKTTGFRDGFGNWCTRLVAPAGKMRLSTDALVTDTGVADVVAKDAKQVAVQALPDATLPFLLGSRYCDTDKLSDAAWERFGRTPAGWERVQAICDFTHKHIKFDYLKASRTRSAFEAYQEGQGVCRDYAHLAIALCRCMNIPARYCTGYLGDVGTPPPYPPGDFAAWFEAYLGDRWYTFDARNNVPRIGRILMARGRDACDVALSTAFGSNKLTGFKVWTDEVAEQQVAVV